MVINQTLVSFFRGRIRLRHAFFKDKDFTEAIDIVKRSFPAVQKLEHSIQTGSILIEYNDDELPLYKNKENSHEFINSIIVLLLNN